MKMIKWQEMWQINYQDDVTTRRWAQLEQGAIDLVFVTSLSEGGCRTYETAWDHRLDHQLHNSSTFVILINMSKSCKFVSLELTRFNAESNNLLVYIGCWVQQSMAAAAPQPVGLSNNVLEGMSMWCICSLAIRWGFVPTVTYMATKRWAMGS